MKKIIYFIFIITSKSVFSQGVVEDAYKNFFLEKGFAISDVAKVLNIKEYIETEVTFYDKKVIDTTVRTIHFNRKGLLDYNYVDFDDRKLLAFAEYKRKKPLRGCSYEFDIDSNAYLITRSVEYQYNNHGMKALELVDRYEYYYYPTSSVEKNTDSTVFLYDKDKIKAELTYRDQKLVYKILYEYNAGDRELKKEFYSDDKYDDIDTPVIEKIEYFKYDSNLTLIQKIEIPIHFASKDTVIIEDTIFVNYTYNKMGEGIKKTKISKKYGNSDVIVKYNNGLPVEVIGNERGNEWRITVFYNDKSLPYKIMQYSTNKGVEELESMKTFEYLFY